MSALELPMNHRREVGELLGTRWEVSNRPVKLEALAVALAEHGLSVRDLVEIVNGGPIEENRAVRERAAVLAADERTEVTALLMSAGIAHAAIGVWLSDPGLPRAGSGALLAQSRGVAAVWNALPHGANRVRLAEVAAQVTDDSHALDADQVLGRAVARLAAAVHGLERPQRAGPTWRQSWAAVGVDCDGVSSRVLVLNLPLDGNSAAARLCSASPGQPLWLTLRSLTGTWSAPAGTPVFVCENPTVVESAADALSDRCPPMVCTDGIASGAALTLLAGLSDAGCAIVARADIDPTGFTIVDQVRSAAPSARLWRFDSAVYAGTLGLPQPGDVPHDVDSSLAQLRDMRDANGQAVYEERILKLLVADLHDLAAERSRNGRT